MYMLSFLQQKFMTINVGAFIKVFCYLVYIECK